MLGIRLKEDLRRARHVRRGHNVLKVSCHAASDWLQVA